MDVNTALQEVLKTALIHDGIPACGIHEAAKALDKHQAHPRVLVSNCDEPTYVKLVEALCDEHQISFIEVDKLHLSSRLAGGEGRSPGEGKLLKACFQASRNSGNGSASVKLTEGKPRQVVGCSCVVVKDYGKESQAKDVIEEYFKCKK